MLTHVGTQSIETERLMLRRFKAEDVQQMFDNWAKDPENVKYLSWQAHKDIGETNKVISDWIEEYKNNNSYRWCIKL